MKETKQHRIILSGGGTGGHIYPAISIANELKSRFPDSEFLFVGAKGKMEMEKVPQAGYNIEGLWISGIQRKLTLKNLSFPFKLIISLLRSRKILKQFKPDVAIGIILSVSAKREEMKLQEDYEDNPLEILSETI